LGSALAIALFLSRVKELIRVGKLVFQPRNWRKTLEFMLQEGLTEEDVFGVIARLEARHSYEGPSLDDDGSAGDVMVFLYPYIKTRLYIKLKIWTDAHGNAGVVMSFHEEGMYE
jgi:hypothetical protein